MADGINLDMDTRDVDRMLGRLLNRVEQPAPLMKQVEKYVHAVTKQMFRGRRPDTTGKRGVRWPPLAESTKWRKRAKGYADRPLVATGKMRDSLRVLRRASKGFKYGTTVKSRKGFAYPGLHNVGGPKVPQRRWLFLTRKDYTQMAQMAVDFLEGRLKGWRRYVSRS